MGDERDLSRSTLANYLGALTYPLKYLYRAHAPEYRGVKIIRQLRKASTELEHQAHRDVPKTREELQSLNRWLDWEEVLEACRVQRTRFEVARGKKQRAREAADLLLVSLYCHIPPSRGLEMRTLEFLEHDRLKSPFSARDFRGRNVAVLESDGSVSVHIQLYKTAKFAGHDRVKVEVNTELCRLIKQFIKEFHQEHITPDTTKTHSSYLFLNARGQPFSAPAFSKHIQGIFYKLTGTGIGINVLRSSFITWAYSSRWVNLNPCNAFIYFRLIFAFAPHTFFTNWQFLFFFFQSSFQIFPKTRPF